MYRYDEFDQAFVRERAQEFRDQVARRLNGSLSEEDFKPLRLMNGLYLQLHAYMLRVAIPYGVLASRQLRKLAEIARTYDKGYGHFTTRQNIQFNWISLEDAPDILDSLAEAEMHAIQTSGNCIRNVTADPFAGVAHGEAADPRVYAEIIRQWSTLHPEFSFLPRKFKIAITGAEPDRAAVRLHDIGLKVKRNQEGELGFEVIVGGGQGRTPVIGKTICGFLPEADLLSYLEAILRVYNQLGRRDNIYKARLKILVNDVGAERFTEMVEAEWRRIRHGALVLPEDTISAIRAHFQPPPYDRAREENAPIDEGGEFAVWQQTNVSAHKHAGYAIVTVSLKPVGGVPGDATADQMDGLAELAERFSFGEVRVTHKQNLVLPHVRRRDLPALWKELSDLILASANVGLVGDIIACPGLDYCNLANARSIPIAQRLSEGFADPKRAQEIGPLSLNLSGCINACGHHHVGNIGILGVDKKGEEFYQITLGGASDDAAAIGSIIGPAFSGDEIAGAVETIVDTYLAHRQADETFVDAYRRVGAKLFKERLYAAD